MLLLISHGCHAYFMNEEIILDDGNVTTRTKLAGNTVYMNR